MTRRVKQSLIRQIKFIIHIKILSMKNDQKKKKRLQYSKEIISKIEKKKRRSDDYAIREKNQQRV